MGSFSERSEPGEVLVLTGVLPRCKHWNIVLYSLFLNSLEHQYRKTSLTIGKLRIDENRKFRIVIGDDVKNEENWLDTEGRKTGLFVIRAVGAEEKVSLPMTEVIA